MLLFGVKKVEEAGKPTIFDVETRAVLFLALCIILFIVTAAVYNKFGSMHLLMIGLLVIFGVGIYFSAIRFQKVRKEVEVALTTNASDNKIQLTTCPAYWQKNVAGNSITCVGKMDSNTAVNPMSDRTTEPNIYYPQTLSLNEINAQNNQVLCERARQLPWPEAHAKCP